MGGDPTRLAGAVHVDIYINPTHTGCVPLDSMVEPSVLVMPPRGEWSGPRRKVRFARLMQRRGRVFGGPAVRAACGDNLIPPAPLLRWYAGAPCFQVGRFCMGTREGGQRRNRL
jgi:hypothetical protein